MNGINLTLGTFAYPILLVLILSHCGSSKSVGIVNEIPQEPIESVSPLKSDYSTLEYLSAGAASVARFDDDAFSQSLPLVTQQFELDANFKQGNFIFRNARNGAGPLINNEICQGCHIKDGRGVLPASESETMRALLFKLSLGQGENGEDIPEPNYGFQLQTLGVNSDGQFMKAGAESDLLVGEAHPFVRYEIINGLYPDGEPYELRKPVYYFSKLTYGDFADGTKTSPRIAPPMIGLGLLEAISEADILARVDPDDTNGDGISGKVKWVFDPTQGSVVLGRFGWKMSTGSVLQQTAGAFMNDMGVTNRYNPDEPCSKTQVDCIAASNREENVGENLDLDDLQLAFVEFYSRVLAVPERRGYDVETETWNTQIAQGKTLYEQVGCNACHAGPYITGVARESVLGSVVNLFQLEQTNEPITALSEQLIWPHTDLLLHDMGGSCDALVRETLAGASCEIDDDCLWVQRCDGLADGRPDGSASGTEWRTSPLWGLGLTKTVLPTATFLHDGRARTIEEAILWHGGEAEASLDAFKHLPIEGRLAVIAFLNSL